VLASPFAMSETRRRAIVTGASGFIGTALVRHLRAGGWEVIGRRPQGVSRRRPDGAPGRRRARRRARWAARRPYDGIPHGRVRRRRRVGQEPAARLRQHLSRRVRGARGGAPCRQPRSVSVHSVHLRPIERLAASRTGLSPADVTLRRRQARGRGVLPCLPPLVRPRRAHRAALQRLRRRHVPLRDPRHRPQDSAGTTTSCRFSATARRSATTCSSTMPCAVWRLSPPRARLARNTTSPRAGPCSCSSSRARSPR